jgi:hypothetical protein
MGCCTRRSGSTPPGRVHGKLPRLYGAAEISPVWPLLDGEVEDALPSAWVQGVGTFAEPVESADTLPTEGFEG